MYAQDCLLSNSITSNTPADWVERGMNPLQQQVSSGAVPWRSSALLLPAVGRMLLCLVHGAANRLC